MNTNSYYGKENSNYKGNKLTTERAWHSRQVAKKGPASKYKCAMCHTAQADDWAEIHGKPHHYKPLCRSCHHKYDKNIQNIQKHDPRYSSLREEILDLI